jgi:hypothetical protein
MFPSQREVVAKTPTLKSTMATPSIMAFNSVGHENTSDPYRVSTNSSNVMFTDLPESHESSNQLLLTQSALQQDLAVRIKRQTKAS